VKIIPESLLLIRGMKDLRKVRSVTFCNPKLRRFDHGASRGRKGSLFPVKMKVLGTEASAGRVLNPATASWMEAYNPTVMSAESFTAESATVEGSPGTSGRAKAATEGENENG
jgi:hypothetical protein